MTKISETLGTFGFKKESDGHRNLLRRVKKLDIIGDSSVELDEEDDALGYSDFKKKHKDVSKKGNGSSAFNETALREIMMRKFDQAQAGDTKFFDTSKYNRADKSARSRHYMNNLVRTLLSHVKLQEWRACGLRKQTLKECLESCLERNDPKSVRMGLFDHIERVALGKSSSSSSATKRAASPSPASKSGKRPKHTDQPQAIKTEPDVVDLTNESKRKVKTVDREVLLRAVSDHKYLKEKLTKVRKVNEKMMESALRNGMTTFDGEGLYLKDEDVRVLAKSVRSQKRPSSILNLKTVLLKENMIGDKGIDDFADSLPEEHVLEKLDLHKNLITSKGVDKLGQRISSVRHLDLSSNTIGDDGIEILAKYLEKAKALEELNLSGCDISDYGCKFLCNSLGNNPNLKRLLLDDNEGITNTSKMHFDKLPKDVSVSICRTGLSKARPKGITPKPLIFALFPDWCPDLAPIFEIRTLHSILPKEAKDEVAKMRDVDIPAQSVSTIDILYFAVFEHFNKKPNSSTIEFSRKSLDLLSSANSEGTLTQQSDLNSYFAWVGRFYCRYSHRLMDYTVTNDQPFEIPKNKQETLVLRVIDETSMLTRNVLIVPGVSSRDQFKERTCSNELFQSLKDILKDLEQPQLVTFWPIKTTQWMKDLLWILRDDETLNCEIIRGIFLHNTANRKFIKLILLDKDMENQNIEQSVMRENEEFIFICHHESTNKFHWKKPSISGDFEFASSSEAIHKVHLRMYLNKKTDV